MVMLTPLYEDPFYDEERGFLHGALADIHFARSMLRRVGKAERDRFSEVGFAYGDSSFYGYNPYEVYDEQLSNVLYTLFGTGYSGDFTGLPVYDDAEQETLDDIRALDGGPLVIDDHHYLVGGDYEELLVTEIRAYETHETGPDGEDSKGRGPTARERLDALVSAMRRSAGEAAAPGLHRWHEGSERARQLRESASPAEALLLVHGFEPCAPHELIHGDIFERLIAAHKEMPKEMRAHTDRHHGRRGADNETRIRGGEER